MKKQTPLMKQYWSIKSQHPDKVLMFRMGDFFEMFHEDAELAAPILNIALTQRNKKSGDETKMCGMPHHSIATPVAKLLAAGQKVAICDQVEDPKEAKGLVKREVTRILSPGMVYDPDTLDALSTNYLAAFDDNSISFLDSTTSEAFYYSIDSADERKTLSKLLEPVEWVLTSPQRAQLVEEGFDLSQLSVHEANDSLRGSHLASNKSLPDSAFRLLSYWVYMQGEQVLKAFKGFERRNRGQTLELPEATVRHLELFENSRGGREGTLFWALNRCKTSAGARCLKSWLRFPLTSMNEIQKRYDEVEGWTKSPQDLKEIRRHLAKVGDLERRLGKMALSGCQARDALSLAQSLMSGLDALELSSSMGAELKEVARSVVNRITQTVVEDPPPSLKDGRFIRRGVDQNLDELIEVAENSQQLVADLEAREKDKTGISNLKVRYNQVFGYYIEISKAQSNKAPSSYQRKQTLTNAERFTTDELNKIEEKVITAKSRRTQLEQEIFEDLRQSILGQHFELMEFTRQLTRLDIVSSLAWLALEQDYVRPDFEEKPYVGLKASRHPVIEQSLKGQFRPNDIELFQSESLLLTGPNMAGKSTVMRQVALTVIMAQVGCFVPASKAKISLFDHIHTRIGASDLLFEGLSTFMVEMQETAQLLQRSGPRSLLILDEIGRGTSTYDGMSLAQSILEYVLTEKKCICLFATHYHELTKLSEHFDRLRNAHMSILETADGIEFLHSLKNGPTNRSYGIQVAKIAGLPKSVLRRAKQILKDLESGEKPSGEEERAQLSLLDQRVESKFEPTTKAEFENVLSEIRQWSLTTSTPLDALNKIAQWQKNLL